MLLKHAFVESGVRTNITTKNVGPRAKICCKRYKVCLSLTPHPHDFVSHFRLMTSSVNVRLGKLCLGLGLLKGWAGVGVLVRFIHITVTEHTITPNDYSNSVILKI